MRVAKVQVVTPANAAKTADGNRAAKSFSPSTS
jgi:hypothetical protein